MNETNQIGTVLSGGYEVIANYRNFAILARQTSPDSPEPWAIWHLKTNGERYSGSYFDNQESAERYFAYLCFEWADERTCTPQALAPEEDDEEPSEENIKKLLWQQLQLLAKESPAQDDLPQKSTAMLEIAQALLPDLEQAIKRYGAPSEVYTDQVSSHDHYSNSDFHGLRTLEIDTINNKYLIDGRYALNGVSTMHISFKAGELATVETEQDANFNFKGILIEGKLDKKICKKCGNELGYLFGKAIVACPKCKAKINVLDIM